jgi:hypothetical protein
MASSRICINPRREIRRGFLLGEGLWMIVGALAMTSRRRSSRSSDQLFLLFSL